MAGAYGGLIAGRKWGVAEQQRRKVVAVTALFFAPAFATPLIDLLVAAVMGDL